MKTLILVVSMLLLTASQTAIEKVYVCDSSTSVAYHKIKSCSGLKKCTHTIVYISVEDAKKKEKRACKICYK